MKADQYNQHLDQVNQEKGYLGKGIYANGQARKPYGAYRFGIGTMEKNGCLAMAIYNCNTYLGCEEGMAEIIRQIRRFGGLALGGLLGARAWFLPLYYKKKGFTTKVFVLPRKSTLEKKITDSSVGILMYFWIHRGIGGHYVTIYRNADSQYEVCNEYDTAEENTCCRTLSCVAGKGKLPLFLYLVRKKD